MPSKPAFLIALVIASVAVAVAAPAQAQARPTAGARMAACATSLSQSGRFLVGEGSMRAQGASRMRIRFDLQIRTPDRPGWRALAAPGFGAWNTADPAVRRYVYQKRVEALAAPASYRMVVQFRWLEGGRPVAQQRRVTPVCSQPDLRPDLAPRRLEVKGSGPGARRYLVRVVNLGGSPSAPSTVVVIVNGTALAPQVIEGLAPGAKAQIAIPGPRCVPGSGLVLRVDADGRVDERDEASNQLVRVCPG